MKAWFCLLLLPGWVERSEGNLKGLAEEAGLKQSTQPHEGGLWGSLDQGKSFGMKGQWKLFVKLNKLDAFQRGETVLSTLDCGKLFGDPWGN